MKRTNFTYLLTITLIIITLTIVVVIQSNNTALLDNSPELIMYGLLTAFALYFSVQIMHSELSMAHVVGMMAFLAYPSDKSNLILLVIFIGGVSGGFLMALRAFLQPPSQRRVRANLNTLVYVTARVTVSYFVATTFYTQTGAPLPLNDAVSINSLTSIITALILFAMVYIGIYTAIFALQLYAEDYPVVAAFRNNMAVIIVILVATVPFAILAAVSPSADESIVTFAIVIAGTMFSTFGLHAISRVTLRLQKQLDEVRALSRISQALTSNLSLQSLYDALYLQIQPLMNIQNFKVILYSEESKQLTYGFVIRAKKKQVTQNSPDDDHNLIQRVIVTRQPIRLKDNVQDQALVKGLATPANLTSWLGVPLLSGNNVIGALVVSSYDDNRHFDTVDEHLLTIIASTASVSIENTRLYEQKSQRAEQLATLNKVATLLSGTLLSDDIIDIIISSASTVTDAHAVALYLPSAGTKNSLQFIKSAGLSDYFHNNPPQPQITELFSTSQTDTTQLEPIIIENIDNVGHDVNIRSYMVAEKKQAWVELPLILSNNNYGVIAVYYDEPQSVTAEQISVMEAFARQATQAINNAQTYAITDEALEVRIEQLYALAAMGRLLNATMNSEKTCRIVLNYAGDTTNAERGFVVLFCPNHRDVDLCSVREYDESLITLDSLSQGINGRVIETKQAFRCDDIRKETGYLPLVPNTRSLMIVPLMRGKDFLGLIRLESNSTRAFTDGDVHFVSQIANQAVIAMDNTSLFQRIRNTRDSLQTILDGMEDSILMINTDKIITIANPPITMLGLDPDDIIQQSIPDLLKNLTVDLLYRLGFASEQELMQVLNHLNNSNQWRNQLTHEYVLSAPDGIRTYIKRQLIPVRNGDDQSATGILMVFYNKTEEHQLAQARDSLSQMIVHDLRSPLTAVTTSLALLNSISSEDDKLKPIIDRTTSASNQAIQKVLSRINSLLDVSKMESGEIELSTAPAELATIVDNILIELSPLAHDMNITLKNNIPDNLPLLLIDSDKVERVLQNLVDNALKYSPRDSEVVLSASPDNTDQSHHVRINIMDTGPGIPDKYKISIFNRYAQIEGRDIIRDGVGLGLTFCRMVTEAHGGKIWIEDNSEQGSIFSLTLPAIKQTKVEQTKS
jgi:K+-sensing histidine kinase KdpD/PAS domain-containing protein